MKSRKEPGPRRSIAAARRPEGVPRVGPTHLAAAWRPAPAEIVLGRDEVHVWRARLDSPLPAAAIASVLSDDERRRAAGIRIETTRDRFTVARALLRLILARYAGAAPESLRFRVEAHGKPALAAPPGRGLEFNLSHSDGLALYAVTRNRPLGIDVERIRRGIRIDEIAARFYPPADARALAAISGARRARAFFESWVCREAWIKASGTTIWEGLRRPLPGRAGGKPRGRNAATAWSITAIDVGRGYAGALAVAGGPVRLLRFDWLWNASAKRRRPRSLSLPR
jgi:4'-phosphopantetheinyl transferase